MIHNTFLVRESTNEILATTQYWPITVDLKDLEEFVTTRADLKKSDATIQEIPLVIGDHKYHGWTVLPDYLLVFVTDAQEDESAIFERMSKAASALKKRIKKVGLEKTIDEYVSLIEPSIITRLKIALVGEGGVGKTTTLHLLLGDTPPTQYVPTIALNLETVENIRFGNYSLVLWDFAGQERFRNLWKFYFHGADVIFLVCDSSLRNILISKDILKLIRRDAPKVPVFALANKQDLPNAMKPEVVQKILGVPTYPMVAIDKERRDEMLRILMNAAAQYVGIALPDLPASELLRFSNEAASAASKMEHLGSMAAEESDEVEEDEDAILVDDEDIEIDDYETIEIVEEVLVDEDGHIIEDGEDYEIVEIVEEVIEDDSEEPGEASATVEEEQPEVVTDSTTPAVASEPSVESSPSKDAGGLEEPSTSAPDELAQGIADVLISDRTAAAEDVVDESHEATQVSDEILQILDSDDITVDESEMSDVPSPEIKEEEATDLDKILGSLDDKLNDILREVSEDEDDTADAESPDEVDSETIEHIKRIIDSDGD
ncbi:MAG: GTP-binding protein [Candidatus Thorarchaeota archaeon]|nr:GTP-binding protein [Candidatus Thorarchaeota archaeon]